MKTPVKFGKKVALKKLFLFAFIFVGLSAFSKNTLYRNYQNNSGNSSIRQFTVYPNPTNGKINLAIDFRNNLPATLTVTDIIGQTMFEKKIMNPENSTFTIDLSNHPKGIYLFNLQQGNQSVSKKIIVE